MSLSSDPTPSDSPADDWKAKLRMAEDSYANLFSGQLTSIDARTFSAVASFQPLDLREAIDLYRGDFIAANACSMPAAEATRKGFDLTIVSRAGDRASQKADAEVAKLILDEYEVGQFGSAFRTALDWDARDGFSALLIGADDGSKTDDDLALPMTRWRKVHRLVPIERCAMSPAVGSKVITDLGSSRYGQPAQWSVTLAGENGTRRVTIDGSRFFVFRGIPVSGQAGGGQVDGWAGGSRLDVLKDPLRRYREVWGAVEGAFRRFSLLVMRMSGLARLMQADDGAGVVKRRLQLISMAMSTLRLVPIDAEAERLEELASSMAGCAEILMRAQDDVSGASGLPLTKLFGHSPAGFSADDEPGKENWQARVQDLQTDKLLTPINELVRLICLSSEGPTKGRLPARWQVTFRPLSIESADTISKRRTQDAATAEAYVRISAVSPDEVREGLRSDPHCPYPLAEDVVDDATDLGDPTLPDDADPSTPDPAAGAAVGGVANAAGATVADVTLTGIQLEGMSAIYDRVASGRVERDAGLAQLEIAFRLTPADALRIMGRAGAGFVPAAAPTKPAAPGDDPASAP